MTTTHLQLDLHGDDGQDALHRVLALCHARQCDVTSVRYERGDRHRPPRLELGLAGEAQQLRRLVGRLEGLVGVGATLPARRDGGRSTRAARATPGAR
ncbi:hypothetical protein [Conexibacter sp. SYSU D00693]|uniref:hypothetical protein n=1 Tax=Conexibacter sp. SYSU D00693 TaxID=2812560 RepID=UPI00196ADF7C|nr:hypothetical protein [Conexibacter sp. SYSU D00693]